MRSKKIDRKTRLYYWLMIAKIVADITIILGIFIILFVVIRAAFL